MWMKFKTSYEQLTRDNILLIIFENTGNKESNTYITC